MKHITWLLVVTLALGCGRDKKAWARKIDKLVDRAYACKDIACAKQVEKEMGAIVGSDEEGRNLDEGEPEFMFSSAERIRNRVAELEATEKDEKLRATSPLTALQIFETTLRACSLAYGDLHGPGRRDVEAMIGKVGATLPPDTVPKAKGPGGILWMDAFQGALVAAMEGKVPLGDALYTRTAGHLCVVNYLYTAAKAKNPEVFAPTVDALERIMRTYDKEAMTAELVAAVRRAAPEEEVFALVKKTTAAILKDLGAK